MGSAKDRAELAIWIEKKAGNFAIPPARRQEVVANLVGELVDLPPRLDTYKSVIVERALRDAATQPE